MSSPSLPGYENLELIGKGGFSRVYRADQSKLKRKVAVKVLNFGLSDEADRIGFARETELMGRVSTHPNIVTVHDTAFTAQGQPCIVMELYPGGSLADLINEVGNLNTREVLEVGVAIASALQASHLAGVLHCDLKPQNILISEFGQPALGDFGISTFAEERTRTGKDAGAGFTLPYAAPEIVEGDSPTIASDVYSLAATLYTSLCGRRPFAYPTEDGSKPTAAEHARRIMLEPVRSLVDQGVPTELDALIRGAMSKEPAERPASAAVFASACHRIGQALGLGTSAPRIADQSALRKIDSEAVGQGQIDLSLVRQRHELELRDLRKPAPAREPFAPTVPLGAPAEVPADVPVDVPVEADEAAAPVEPSIDLTRPRVVTGGADGPSIAVRRRAATGIGVLALITVIAVLFVATRGSSNSVDRSDSAPVASSAAAAATDPALAPTQPADVRLERTGAHAVTVTWTAPTAELEAGDVVYEVRREDGGNADPWVSRVSQVTMPAVANDEGVCVTVLAVRANRAASPTAPSCSPPLAVDVTLEPAECAAPCEIALGVIGPAIEEPHTLEILDRNARSMADRGITTDGPFTPPDGSTIQVDESVVPGEYLAAVTFPDGPAQTVLFTVLGP